jgi:hypothetical protein
MAALERHYTVAEVAKLWQLSEDTIRGLFRDRPDVVKIGSPEKRNKRSYFMLRIPESALQKVHAELRA